MVATFYDENMPTCCSDHAEQYVIDNPVEGIDLRLSRMFVCSQCGNKRCPKATNCNLDCTNSNDPGQEGSRYQ